MIIFAICCAFSAELKALRQQEGLFHSFRGCKCQPIYKYKLTLFYTVYIVGTLYVYILFSFLFHLGIIYPIYLSMMVPVFLLTSRSEFPCQVTNEGLSNLILSHLILSYLILSLCTSSWKVCSSCVCFNPPLQNPL